MRLVETWPDLCESAEKETASVAFDGFVCETIPEEQNERKDDWNPWPVLDIGKVGRVQVENLIPN